MAVQIPGSQLSTPALSEGLRAQPNYRPPKSARRFVSEEEVSELKASGYFVRKGLLAGSNR